MVASTRSSKRGHRELSPIEEVVSVSSGLSGDVTPGPSTRKRSRVTINIGSSTGPEGTSLFANDRKKTTRAKLIQSSESDDDYVSETPPHRTMANAPHKQSWGSLKTRSSPRQLFLAVSRLTSRQREVVKEMGFGALLGFVVDGIPVKLAHYVVDVFQPERMRLRCRQREVAIDASVVHRVFGIPTGGVKFSSFTEPDDWDAKLKIWRDRYPSQSYVSPSLIVTKIQDNDYEDLFFFKVDFVMLFVTTMISSHGNGLCREEIAKCFTSDTDFASIDWCDYMITSLQTCKQKWRRSDPGCAFAGPLTFLTLLYVDSFTIGSMNTPVGVRPTRYWSLELLSKRQDYEIQHGGFGLGRLKDVTIGAIEDGGHTDFTDVLVGGRNEDLETELCAARENLTAFKASKLRMEGSLASLTARYPNNSIVAAMRADYTAALYPPADVGVKGPTLIETPSKAIKTVVADLAEQHNEELQKDATNSSQGTLDIKKDCIGAAGGASDSCDSSEGGEWVIARVSPRTADRVPADDGLNTVKMAVDDGVPHSGKQKASENENIGVVTGAATKPTLAPSACLTPDTKTIASGATVKVSGQRPTSVEKEMDAHRRRFGLSSIWTSNDCTSGRVEGSLSQPSFSLGLTQDIPPAVGPSVVIPSFGLCLTPQQPAALSQPSFSLGLTQEAKETVIPVAGVPAGRTERHMVSLVEAKTAKADALATQQRQAEAVLLPNLKNTSIVQKPLAQEAAPAAAVLLPTVKKTSTIEKPLGQEAAPAAAVLLPTVKKTSTIQKPLGQGAAPVGKPSVSRGVSRGMVARLPVIINSESEIDIHNTKREKLVWEWLFKTTDKREMMERATLEATKEKHAVGTSVDVADIDPTEHYPYVLFETRYGFRCETPLLQSLAVGRRLYESVVDAWVNVLNNDPLYQSAGGVRRLFLPTTAIVEWMLALDDDPTGSRVASLKNGMLGALCGDDTRLDLQSFDLVFIPVLDMEHYYLMIFDFKHQDICYIDNIVPKKSPVVLADSSVYLLKSTPFKVKQIFMDYLLTVNHPKAAAMRECTVRRVPVPWATSKNTQDCGVFVMCHMENYCGVSAPFRCGFNVNGKRKQSQLDALRKRYAATILLSCANIYTNRIWHDANTK